MASRGGWRPLLAAPLLLLGLLAAAGALPETEVVRVLQPDAAGATTPATAPLATLPVVSRVQCAARCLRHADCLAISYAPAGDGGSGAGLCSLRGCPAGWRGWRGSCYLVSAAAVPRSQAAADCAARAAALATITSQEEHDFVRQLTLDSSAVRVYLGLRHQPAYSETICACGDGNPLVFATWGHGI